MSGSHDPEVVVPPASFGTRSAAHEQKLNATAPSTNTHAPAVSLHRSAPLTTLPLVALECLLLVALVGLVDTESVSFHVSVYAHAGVFGVVYACNLVVHHQLKKHRACGYLAFYRQSNAIRRIPLTVLAIGNAALFPLVLALDDKLTPLMAVVSIELVAMLVAMIPYSYLVLRQHRARQPPDVLRSLEGNIQSPLLGSGGVRNEGTPEEIIDRQIDLIHFLQNQQQYMSKELLVLQERLKAKDSGVTLQSGPDRRDFDYLVRQKEKEVRALTAERDELVDRQAAQQQELESKDQIVNTLRQANRQNVSEVCQLRDTIEQWRERYARLELMVEMERDANKEAQSTIDRLRMELSLWKSGPALDPLSPLSGTASDSTSLSPRSLSGSGGL